MSTANPVLALLFGVVVVSGCAAYAAAPDKPASYLTLAQADTRDASRNSVERSDDDELKMVALQALMNAPPERALPLVEKVLDGNASTEVKSRALFVLGQLDVPRARALLLDIARNAGNPLQHDAIRMIGIGGDPDTVAQLGDIYRQGDAEIRQSVLGAYMIAGDPKPLLEIARNAPNDDAFADAVRMLGAMGATAELRQLQQAGGNAEGLIHAFAIAGDLESLSTLAAQTDDPEQRAQAIRSIGIVGGEQAQTSLMAFYRSFDDEASKEAALQGLLISDYDQGVLELFRASDDAAEQRKLLRTLVNMNSELAFEVIDSTLDGGAP